MEFQMENLLRGPGAARRAVVGLFVLFQACLIFVMKHDTLDLDVGPNTQPTENIYQGNRVGQTFVARADNVARVDVAMGTHGRANDGTVFFRLWEETPERTLLRETAFNAAAVKNNLFHTVRFKPVSDTMGRTYYFVFSSAESTYENSICAWMNRHDIYPEGRYFLRHEPGDGDLMFRVYSRETVAGGMSRVVRKYGGVFGSPAFFAAAMALFAAAVTVLFSKLLGLLWPGRPAGSR
jgi:hypothetical protein